MRTGDRARPREAAAYDAKRTTEERPGKEDRIEGETRVQDPASERLGRDQVPVPRSRARRGCVRLCHAGPPSLYQENNPFPHATVASIMGAEAQEALRS